MSAPRVRLSDSDVATILAALRVYQQEMGEVAKRNGADDGEPWGRPFAEAAESARNLLCRIDFATPVYVED